LVTKSVFIKFNIEFKVDTHIHTCTKKVLHVPARMKGISDIIRGPGDMSSPNKEVFFS